MSKIAEQKALKAYPIDIIPDDDALGLTPSDRNEDNDIIYGYIKGYDQAMKDIEEFFYDRFNIHPHDCHVVQYVSDTPLENMDDFIEQFKNYIEMKCKDCYKEGCPHRCYTADAECVLQQWTAKEFDWQSFRAEAAKDILCAMIAKFGTSSIDMNDVVKLADSLIAKL